MSAAVTYLAAAPVYEDPRYGYVHELAGEATGLPALGVGVAIVRAGATSPAHFHSSMSEVYLITAGQGLMRLGAETLFVTPGTCISIAPGVVHALTALGETPLVFTVVTSPSYDIGDDIEVGEDER